jgi:hypothetical protein
MSAFSAVVAGGLTCFARIVTGAQARWIGCAQPPVQRVYFGNHASHADFALIWTPPPRRGTVKPENDT